MTIPFVPDPNKKTHGDKLLGMAQRLPPEAALLQINKAMCEQSLEKFVETAWPYLNNGGVPFKSNWHISMVCEHLEAISRGEIRRMVFNLPPRSLKSILVSVAWPMWTWAQSIRTILTGPQVKFLCASYNQDLSWQLSGDSRRLVQSPFYQDRWGRSVRLTSDQNTKTQFDNTEGGSRFATSVGGSLLGIGGQIIIADDLQNVNVLSEVERETSIEWFKELSTTRFNDPATGAMVVVMQRLHQLDLTGYLQEFGGDEWVYAVVPMEFEPKLYQVPTPLGWLDPRGLSDDGTPLDGEALEERKGLLLHPERVPQEEVQRLKDGLGPYLASGRLQQSPVPLGGAIIKEEWWKLWESPNFPPMGTVIASLDGAFTEKEENDPSALTVWGCFKGTGGEPCLMLMDAWERRLNLNELVQAVAATSKQHRIDTLLIEARASGHSTAQELQRLFGSRNWQTLLIPPKGDKVARTLATVPFFAAGTIYAPDKDYAQKVIAQAAIFPKGAHDDLVDASTQAILWLRANGSFVTKEEYEAERKAAFAFKRKAAALYDI